MDVRVGPQRRLSTKELMLLNCDPGEDSLDCSLEGTDAEAVAPILWPPDVKSWLIGKDPDAGKDSEQEVKGVTDDEMVAGHHQLNEDEFE